MQRIKKVIMVILLISIFPTLLFGCNQSSDGAKDLTPHAAQDLKPVDLVMYLIGSPARDYDEVLAKFNEKLKTDINAIVKVKWIGWGDIGTKYPLVLASGEPIDLIYTATWLGFHQESQRGAFLPLEEIGPKYAPKSFDDEPTEGLNQATVVGHIYALPPNYVAYATLGSIVRGDLRRQYGLDSIETLDDYGAYLDMVVNNNPELYPTAMYSTQTPIDGLYFYGQNLYPLSGDVATNSPFWIDFTDPEAKVVNIVEKSDLPDLLAKFYEWSQKGYWSKALLSNKDNEMLKNGKAASSIHNLDAWVGIGVYNPEYKLEYTTMIKKSYLLPMMQDGMAIPASSENPERALMMLELLRNDPSYYNLLTYGIEGKHYEITNDGMLLPLDQEGFIPEGYCSWGYRDTNLKYKLVGSPSNLSEIRASIAANSVTNIYTMFNINIDLIKDEYAAILNVMKQYYVPLKLGYVEPVRGLEELKKQLKAAGIDKVQAEVQKQIDTFRAAHSQN